MDRRAKKLEKARKRREQMKKRDRAQALKDARDGGPLVRSAARAPFGPCWLSLGWDEEEEPQLVTALVTRRLGDGRLLPVVALVDRTCLGVKDAFLQPPMEPSEVEELSDTCGTPHGGMVQVDPITMQSVVFHAVDYARRFGFEPHPDFPAALFGPRPDTLQSTPWHAAERPIYMVGPNDNVRAIANRLATTVGESGFEFVDLREVDELDSDLEDEDDFEDAVIAPPDTR